MNNLLLKIQSHNYIEANRLIEDVCGIVECFNSDEEKNKFISFADIQNNIANDDRISYGDWQTPLDLADAVCRQHMQLFGSPDIVIEPTCGKGAFVLSSLHNFPSLSEIYALEINHEYAIELKFKILSESLQQPQTPNVRIHIITGNFFSFDFSSIIKLAKSCNKKLAIIGNPPWVTVSTQGTLESDNVPNKLNKYGLKGIDAITGKSNFDISEAITLRLLSVSSGCTGGISFLLKNSVIRSIVSKQRLFPMDINDIRQYCINASKEFKVAVDASCMTAHFGNTASMTCEICDFYDKSYKSTYGWHGDLFVSDVEKYGDNAFMDGVCPYTWRSGIKHDCADVLELEMRDGYLYNGLGEKVDIEHDLIYPLMKSSDVAKYDGNAIHKFILLTQRYVGEDTVHIYNTLPKTYKYLYDHIDCFSRRKSSIYKGKDSFSIFGVGSYSFLPFKIVISSLYKKISFSLVEPYCGKPVMVDDTCYQIGFSSLQEAKSTIDALNRKETMNLIDSITFKDSKRVVTKALLMRLDISKLSLSKVRLPGKTTGSFPDSLFDWRP